MLDDSIPSKGGKARASKMTKAEKSESARRAVQARWAKNLPEATHDGVIELADGDIKINCAVLDTTKRLLTQETFLMTIGRAGKAKAGTGSRSLMVEGMPPFLAAENLKPFITDELREATTPIVYRTVRGQRAFGYEATLLPKVCEVYLRLRDEGTPLRSQEHIVKACDILMRALARVGIVALVDEATGYERDKKQRDLATILEAFVAKELQPWIPTFDLELYELMCEIREEPLDRVKKRPPYFGKLTNNVVYKRLAPGVLEELRNANPVRSNGRRRHKHHQHLTRDVGHPKLREHLAGVITTMKLAKAQGQDWQGFLKMLDVTHPIHEGTTLFDEDDRMA